MLTQLDNVQLPDKLDIPAEFKAAHFVPADLVALLGFDRFGETSEWEFWQAYKAGLIPPGVWLPTCKPLCVWEKRFIGEWIDAGCPTVPGVVEHHRNVYAALLQCVEDTLPARPATQDEAN